MIYHRLIHFSLSIVLLLSVLSINIPPVAVSSMPTSIQAGTSQETIIPGEEGLEKLAPDLRALLETAPVFDQALAYDLQTRDPLLVTAIVQPGADVQRFFTRSVRSRQVAGVEWVTGEINLPQLRKLASVAEVMEVISNNTFQTAEAPGLEELRGSQNRMDRKQVRALLAQGGPEKLLEQVQAQRAEPYVVQSRNWTPELLENLRTEEPPVKDLLDIHDVKRARAEGYTGEGVTVGVVDTGVDFSHPDLQGTHAVIKDGPYAGWPYAYDTVSGLLYSLNQDSTLGPDNYWDQAGATGYTHTLPVENPNCSAETCTAKLELVRNVEAAVTSTFTWSNTSKSRQYYYSVHPDYYLALQAYNLGINYPEGWLLPPVMIVSDEQTAGVYDTVYVDMNFNNRLMDAGERMTKTSPLAGASIGSNPDTTWDLSAGILTWISDGVNQPPGIAVLYPEVQQKEPPANGRLLIFVLDQEGHGTSCASVIAGQARITDPKGHGPSNPLYAGGADVGGVGGAVIPTIAPGAKIAAFQNGFVFPFDAWTLAAYGMDGDPSTNDGVNIVSNSWGDSELIPDGWDSVSRFAQHLAYTEVPSVSFFVATGNGGHGFGTRTSPGGGPIIDVGASTAYGSLLSFDFVTPQQFLYGDVQPWSNRGPGMLGDLAPDVVAVGAYGTAALPLNTAGGDGEEAYSVFGGTSMSTPVAAGGMAVIYQAFQEQNGRWPTWQEARDLLLTSARSLGHDVLAQGSGNLQVSRAVDMALQHAPSVTPSQWQAGGFHGSEYAAFPAILHPGTQDTQAFTVKNPGPDPAALSLSDNVLQRVHEETFTFSYNATEASENIKLPIFLKDISAWIEQNNPDFVRAQVAIPYINFDVEDDKYADNWWNLYFYDWTDTNGDGNLWLDTNRNGRVDKTEIDINPETKASEINRFTYGYPQSDFLEATVSGANLRKRHNGVFLGLGCNFCGESTTLQVRVTFYRKVDWNWLTLSATQMSVPGNGQADFQASLVVPADAAPGAYEGAIALTIDGKETTLPVIAQVAANSSTFRFGGPEDLGMPYDNARMFGGFNWNWRYESGDWRTFFMDIPPGSSGPGKSLVVDTLWNGPLTDIDTWLLGPKAGQYALPHPDLFGPYDLALSSGSQNGYMRNGKFSWATSTGTSREMVAAPVKDGLNLIALHNVLNDGLKLDEPFAGRVYQVSSDPGELLFQAEPETINPPYLSGTQTVTFTATADIPEGLHVQAFGMSPAIFLKDQVVRQDSSSDICSASWIYRIQEGGLEIHNGGVLDITASSMVDGLDLDVYLYKDDGDKRLNCSRDTLKTYSFNEGADEQIKIYFPEDGRYWLLVHGMNVPDKQKTFDIRIRSVSGTDLTIENIPTGAVQAGQPVAFNVKYHGAYAYPTQTELDGFLLIGTPSVPQLIEVPVRVRPTVLLYPAPVFTASNRWVAQTPATFRLAVQNLGINNEITQTDIQLPEGLVYEPDSASGPGTVQFDAASNILSWTGPADGGKTAVLTFRATADPDFSPQQVELVAQVTGQTSGQQWSVKTGIGINQYGQLLPYIRR